MKNKLHSIGGNRLLPLLAVLSLASVTQAKIPIGNKLDIGEGYVPTVSVTHQTSKSGDKLKEGSSVTFADGSGSKAVKITINTNKDNQKQEIVGIGGSMTQASASVLKDIPTAKRSEVIKSYFHPTEGIGYTMSRLCIGSSDFSTGSFVYAENPSDNLDDFSIAHDLEDVVPLVKDALAESGNNIKIVSSAWTGPAWMKNNNNLFGGSIIEDRRDEFALYISKYITAYEAEGIPIWAITPENEPVGNNGSWESMEWDAQSMAWFVNEFLGPKLEEDHPDVLMFIFDQNKDEMHHWAETIINEGNNKSYVDGVAIHWYSNTREHYGPELSQMHDDFPEYPTLGTEHSIDNIKNPPNASIDDGNFFNNDTWFWEKHVGGWGAAWANPPHEIVSALYRYARDIIVDLNNWTIGWIDWNFVLNKEGAPNHVGNYCLAPVMIDTDSDDVYYTPLFYTMGHFSKFIRPGSRSLTYSVEGRDGLYLTPVLNADGKLAVVILNDQNDQFDYSININGKFIDGSIEGNALQTVVIETDALPLSSSSQVDSSPDIISSSQVDSSPDIISSEASMGSSVVGESAGESSAAAGDVSSSEELSSGEVMSSNGEDDGTPIVFTSKQVRSAVLFSRILNQGELSISVAQQGSYSVKIYDIVGKLVAQLQTDVSAAGTHTVDVRGLNLSDGMFLIQAEKLR